MLKELAEVLGLKPATITVMLNRMEKAGWYV
ncbi:MAG: MarR family transcriptional regulator [Eubacteriales bacterium]